jgi:hypothetical protein
MLINQLIRTAFKCSSYIRYCKTILILNIYVTLYTFYDKISSLSVRSFKFIALLLSCRISKTSRVCEYSFVRICIKASFGTRLT